MGETLHDRMHARRATMAALILAYEMVSYVAASRLHLGGVSGVGLKAAYIDPGLGTMVVQLLVATVIGLVYGLVGRLRRVSAFLRRAFHLPANAPATTHDDQRGVVTTNVKP